MTEPIGMVITKNIVLISLIWFSFILLDTQNIYIKYKARMYI
jgi:hypothetical protein